MVPWQYTILSGNTYNDEVVFDVDASGRLVLQYPTGFDFETPGLDR